MKLSELQFLGYVNELKTKIAIAFSLDEENKARMMQGGFTINLVFKNISTDPLVVA